MWQFVKPKVRLLKLIINRRLLKRFDGWVRIYPTLECNLRCSYCVNEFWPEMDKKNTYEQLPAEAWIDIINKLGRDVIFTGGEPFLYPDLIKVINNISPKLKIKIYTNFMWDSEEFIREVNRQVEFYGSYHPCSGKPEKFLENINKLRSASKFNGSIHGILYEKQSKFMHKSADTFKKSEWNLELDDDQYEIFEGSSKKFRKRVQCMSKSILIAPDGIRYQCVSKMVRKVGGHENLVHKKFKGPSISQECFDYGYCAPCDGLGVRSIRIIK